MFVDLAKEANALATVIPRDSRVLDIGGGDGEPINYLLALRPDLHITTLDPGPVVGQWIEARFDRQVVRLPGTTLAEYVTRDHADPDAILIADVLHHIPEARRPGFLSGVKVLLDRVPGLRIVIKEVEPGYLRAVLGYWSDRYVTGDREVSPISRNRLASVLQETLGPLRRVETDLFETNRPNYAIAFFR